MHRVLDARDIGKECVIILLSPPFSSLSSIFFQCKRIFGIVGSPCQRCLDAGKTCVSERSNTTDSVRMHSLILASVQLTLWSNSLCNLISPHPRSKLHATYCKLGLFIGSITSPPMKARRRKTTDRKTRDTSTRSTSNVRYLIACSEAIRLISGADTGTSEQRKH